VKLTDEAVEALSVSLIGAPWATFDEGLLNTLRAIHREALEAALPHLTDDGAGSGEPAVAAGEAGSNPAGNPAPSSPHPSREALLHAVPTWLTAMQARSVVNTLLSSGVFGEGATPATCGHQLVPYEDTPPCVIAAGVHHSRHIDAQGGYWGATGIEAATPAIDREALKYLLSYHYYDAKWSKEHQGFRCVCGWLGEDHVRHVVDLIGAPNSGASEDDR
jgi:hypothetical protein